MLAPIFEITAADPAVKILLGAGLPDDPIRFYSFGDAPTGVALPYAVWRNISGQPINYLSGRPDSDEFHLQVDVYGRDRASVRAVTKALNDCLELKAYVTRWGDENRDATTRNFHFDFDVEFITGR